MPDPYQKDRWSKLVDVRRRPMKSAVIIVALTVSTAVAVGQQIPDLDQYRHDLETNPRSSLAHFRIAEILSQQGNYQGAANEFREALNGDLDPKWTEVWSHINLGKIFDISGQRERAVSEYNLAIRTKDDTQGAQEEAGKYLKVPYERQRRVEQ